MNNDFSWGEVAFTAAVLAVFLSALICFFLSL